jgi:hypothetical protein
MFNFLYFFFERKLTITAYILSFFLFFYVVCFIFETKTSNYYKMTIFVSMNNPLFYYCIKKNIIYQFESHTDDGITVEEEFFLCNLCQRRFEEQGILVIIFIYIFKKCIKFHDIFILILYYVKTIFFI